jgi:hypothetical protein
MKLAPGIQSTMDELAPLTVDLAHGLADGIDVFAGHLEKALVNSKPLIEWTASELPKLLDDVGGLLEEMSQHTQEAEFALDSLFGALKVGIKTLEVFTEVGAAAIKVPEFLATGVHNITGLGRAYDGLSHSLRESAGSAEVVTTDQANLRRALDATTHAFEDQINQMLAADNTAIDYQQNIDNLTESVHKNGRSFDINTQKGRDNKRVLDQLVGSIEQTYESNIAAGMGADKASLAFLAQEGALKKQMEALHLSKSVIDDYISKLDAMRYAAIAANNAINDTGVGHTHHDSYPSGHAASGAFLPSSNPGTILAAEPSTGRGEWLIPEAGISLPRARDLLQGAASAHGLTVGPAGGGGGTDQAMLAALLAEQRRTNELLAGLDFSVSSEGLALAVRRGNKQIAYAGG